MRGRRESECGREAGLLREKRVNWGKSWRAWRRLGASTSEVFTCLEIPNALVLSLEFTASPYGLNAPDCEAIGGVRVML